jgi:hypothetical protein
MQDPLRLRYELGIAGSTAIEVSLDLTGMGPEEMVVERLERVELRVAARARMHLHRHGRLPRRWT